MPYRVKTKRTTISSFGNSQTERFKSDVHNIMDEREFNFFELEPVRVEIVYLDKDNPETYGAIEGSWVKNSKGVHDKKPTGIVLPLDPHIKRFPVVGEIVICVEYYGKPYYTSILNFKNNSNNNIQFSKSTEQNINFQTIDEDLNYQRGVVVNPGDILINGRFNSSIKVGENKLNPSIQLVAGHNSPNAELVQDNRIPPKDELKPGEMVEYDINKDAASIYIEDGGVVDVHNPNKEFETYPVKGKKIILDADVIVINARQHLRLQAGNLLELLSQDTEIKHNKNPKTGDKGSIFTGETKDAIDNFRTKFIREIQREIDLCISDLRFRTGLTQENFDQVKKLHEKLDKFFDEPIANFVEALPTVKFNEYNDLVTRFNNIVAELPTIPPNDPVRLARVGAELIEVLNDFSTLSFLRPDIITD